MSKELFPFISLPEFLNRDDLRNCFVKYQAGDLSFREVIIKHNMRLVISRVNRFDYTFYDKEELVSVGMIGLINAIDSFDLSKNIQFSTYASRCIDNAILMFMRSESRVYSVASLDDVLYLNRDNKTLTLGDILYDSNADFVIDLERKDSLLFLRHLIECFSKRDRMILVLSFGLMGEKKLTQREIADKLHMSRSNVAMRLSYLLKQLKSQLNGKSFVKEKKIK